MLRENSNDIYSNSPVNANRDLSAQLVPRGYFRAAVTIDRGRNEWKAGVESDSLFLNEKLNYFITDPFQFSPGSPLFLITRPIGPTSSNPSTCRT